EREVHDLADLIRMGPRETSAKDGEVLGKDADLASGDRSIAGHHSVAQKLLLLHGKVRASMGHEFVELDEGARIQEKVDPFAGRQLSGSVLLGDPFRAPAFLGSSVPLRK